MGERGGHLSEKFIPFCLVLDHEHPPPPSEIRTYFTVLPVPVAQWSRPPLVSESRGRGFEIQPGHDKFSSYLGF